MAMALVAMGIFASAVGVKIFIQPEMDVFVTSP
jgi:hypothetical protein